MEASKKTRSKERGGMSTGGSYLRVDKIARLEAMLQLPGTEGSPEQLRSFIEKHLQYSDEQIDVWLEQQEFERVAEAAFPQHTQTICDLHEIALKIAKLRRNESDLRPPEQVKDKLLSEEVPQFYQVRSSYEQGTASINQVVLRLGSITYYSVQAFAHDLRQATKMQPGSVDALHEVIRAFQQLIQRYCLEAHVIAEREEAITLGLEAGHRKFWSRALLGQRNDRIEETLIEELLRQMQVPSTSLS